MNRGLAEAVIRPNCGVYNRPNLWNLCVVVFWEGGVTILIV